jgi:hypothetical protein
LEQVMPKAAAIVPINILETDWGGKLLSETLMP